MGVSHADHRSGAHWIDEGTVYRLQEPSHPELVISLRSRFTAVSCNRAAEGVLIDESIKGRVPHHRGDHWKIKEENKASLKISSVKNTSMKYFS